ncbi:MAG TPA: bifunctional O-antigen ligase/aminoglycoside phosphotransferase family protein [Thermoanaerobaculia bacterium]
MTAFALSEQISSARPDAETITPRLAGLIIDRAFPLFVLVLYADLSRTLMRSFGIPSILQFLLALLVLAIVLTGNRLQPLEVASHPVVLLLAGYAVVVFGTSIWVVDSSLADARLSETLKALLVCVVIGVLARNWTTLRVVLLTIVAAAASLSLISIFQIATDAPEPLLGGLLLLESGTIYGSVTAPRAAGPPVSDPNFYARLLLIALPLAVAAAFVARRVSHRLLYGAAALTITLAVLLTYSRGAMLTLGLVALLSMIAFRAGRRTFAVLFLVSAVTLSMLPDDVTKRFLSVETAIGDGEGGYDSSVEKRRLLMRSGLLMFVEHPFFGVGAGHFGLAYPRYANRAGTPFIDYHPPGTSQYPHGLYLEVASETGIFGLLTFCGALLAAALAIHRTRRTLLRRGESDLAAIAAGIGIALAGYGVASIFLHETHLRYTGLLLGLVIATGRLANPSRREKPETSTANHVDDLLRADLQSMSWNARGVSEIEVVRVDRRIDSVIAAIRAPNGRGSHDLIFKQHRTRAGESRPADERAQHEFDVLAMLKESMGRAPDTGEWQYSVPDPHFVDTAVAALVLDRASGMALDAVMKAAKQGGTPAKALAEPVRHAGIWLRTMQHRTRSEHDGYQHAALLARGARTDLSSLAADDWGLRRRRDDLTAHINLLERGATETAPVVSGHHGDYWPGNIFIGERRVEVIDFEGYREGLALEDVAYFHIFLDLMFPRHRECVSPLRQTFLEAYAADVPIDRAAFELSTLSKAMQMLLRKRAEPLRSPVQLWTRRRLRGIILESLA